MNILAAFATSLVVYITWLVSRRFLRKSLDRLSGPPPSSWLFGNIPDLFNPNGWNFHRELMKNYGSVIKMRGVLGERLLLVYDAKALYHIIVKDQHVYEIATPIIIRANLLIGTGLLGTAGDQHRKQRKILNPVFSANHMRDLVPIFYEVTERLRVALQKKVENGPQEIDALNWMSRAALEIIGQSGMDYSFDSLVDDNDYHPYSRVVKRFSSLVNGPFGFLGTQLVLPLAEKINLPRFKRFIAERIPYQRVQDIIYATDVMYRTSIDIIEAKKKAMESPHPEVVAEMASKKDIISLLMRANAEMSEEDRLTDVEVIGQVSTFVFAAMDTTTSAVARILHLIATHQDVQDRLRKEIQEAQLGDMNYDKLVSLPYLDAVCRETLRVYPPIPLIPPRTAGRDIVLPLSKPILDSAGKEVTEILVEKGTNIVIPVFGVNKNPDVWGPDVEEWKPERWLSPLPKSVEEAHIPGVYSHLMTFLGGGRSCPGFKFSQLEMKVMLSVLLASFRFSLSDKPIDWRMNGITGPVVEGADENKLQLPLQLSLI